MNYIVNIKEAIAESNKLKFDRGIPVVKNLKELCEKMHKGNKDYDPDNVYAKLYRWSKTGVNLKFEKNKKILELCFLILGIDQEKFLIPCKTDPES